MRSIRDLMPDVKAGYTYVFNRYLDLRNRDWSDAKPAFYKFKTIFFRFVTGTGANLVSSFLVMPLNYVWTSKQDKHNPKNYGESIRYIASRQGLVKVYSASINQLKL